MREELIQQLEENLRRQLALYRELLETAGQKQETLVANDVKALEEIVAREEQLILQAAQLEKQRLTLTREAAADLQLPPAELTLGKLVEDYPQFIPIQEELDTVIMAIQEKQKSNKQLIEQAMKIIDFSLQLITQHEDTTYSRLMQNAKTPERESRGTNRVHFIDKSV